jgi:hydroxyquinol 1,2-dioxygenase
MVSASGMRAITTEVFFDNTEYLDNDAVFGVRRSLVAKVQPARKVEELGFELEARPDAMIHYDFVLAPAG